MSFETPIPSYLSDDFSMYLENMESLTDPENPDLLTNYLKVLSAQLASNSSVFNGLVDQLAMAITRSVRIDSKNLAKLDVTQQPAWADIKPFVGVHADARATITELMNHSESELKTAVLLIHFYNTYDATPLPALPQDVEADDDTEQPYATYGYDE
ncbi:hypothetical protein [Paraglaciecola sp. MB-3u-78]|jgi:hypothetical protein|uniref:hypothetical protein n=1 Tax=Paraglaciecola sp. MB-3u-78 TaxID=2058332 RepID=UPI000C321D6A|nr:hypothetical protein [Paraglaciecola sp. MB-3u-78]PKG98166.1 hypothetical protein CXF95_17440 [Paraglaciecola sp. MB-3u-78]